MPEKRPLEGSPEHASNKKMTFFAVDTSIIKITVGEKKVEFLVHESVMSLCPFFEKCLSAGMKEQYEKTIDLPEDHPDAIGILVGWLYSGKLNTKFDNHQLILGYVTAEKYFLPELQNAIMDSIREKFCVRATDMWEADTWYRVRPKWVEEVCKHTTQDSKLRKLALDFLYQCLGLSPKEYTVGEASNPEYAKEMLKLFADVKISYALTMRLATKGRLAPGTKALVLDKGCYYHVHEDGKKCDGSMKEVCQKDHITRNDVVQLVGYEMP